MPRFLYLLLEAEGSDEARCMGYNGFRWSRYIAAMTERPASASHFAKHELDYHLSDGS